MKDAGLRSPVSFVANVARLPQRGLPVVVEADQRQREALAAEHELLSVESYRAALDLAPTEAERRFLARRLEQMAKGRS